MSSFRIRPRFKHLTAEDKDAIEIRIKSALSLPEPVCNADILPGYINLKIGVKDKHFWSPQLNLTFEETEDGTIIRGLYGPNPTVWAIFFFGYIICGITATIAAMWGFARYNLGMSAEILWVLPVISIFAIALYITAQMGQKIGAEQMYRLHHFYEDLIKDKVPIS